jgi:membrane fusion protein, multidrug efflux system
MALKFTWRRALAISISVILIAAIAGGVALRASRKAAAEAPGNSGGPPVTLEFTPADIARIEVRELARWLPVSGTLQPVDQSTVKAKVSGEIREVRVREGEAVKSGQVLARLDTADLNAKLTDRIGALEASRAQLALAEKTRSQNHALLKQGFISQNAYDSAESNLSVTQGTLKSYEAQVQLARNALRDAVVMAPLSGTLAKRHVQPGEKVNFDSPLFTIVDLARMELQAMVPANDIPEIKPGMAVELSIDGFGDRAFTGSVERINPMTEAGTRAIMVFVQIPNADAALRGGMFATGRIRLAGAAAVPTLPATAIRTEAGQTFVWTIEGGRLSRRNVSLGRRDEAAARIEIKNTLPAGAQVLGARFDNLKDGASAVLRGPAADKPAGAG